MFRKVIVPVLLLTIAESVCSYRLGRISKVISSDRIRTVSRLHYYSSSNSISTFNSYRMSELVGQVSTSGNGSSGRNRNRRRKSGSGGANANTGGNSNANSGRNVVMTEMAVDGGAELKTTEESVSRKRTGLLKSLHNRKKNKAEPVEGNSARPTLKQSDTASPAPVVVAEPEPVMKNSAQDSGGKCSCS